MALGVKKTKPRLFLRVLSWAAAKDTLHGHPAYRKLNALYIVQWKSVTGSVRWTGVPHAVDEMAAFSDFCKRYHVVYTEDELRQNRSRSL